MRKSLRVLAVVLAALSVLSMTALFTASASSQDTDDVNFKEKIVSVLYDNSGSMDDKPDRLECAQYALGTLVSLLNTTDTLVITPLYSYEGSSKVETTKVSQGIPVPLLEESKRNEVVNDLLKNPVFGAIGATPAGPLDVAVQQLYDRGYSNEDRVDSNKEFWLIIMTDGGFDNLSTSMEAHIGTYVKANPNMNIVYMSMGHSAVVLKDSNLDKADNLFKAYHAEGAADICSDMQKIANRLSGRYTLPQTAVSREGNRISIDLSACKYNVRSVSFVAQNTKATLKKVEHGNDQLSFKQGTSIHVTPLPSSVSETLYDGYSAAIEGNPIFEGGKLYLTFDETKGKIDLSLFSVMIEPALSVKIVPLAYVDNAWQTVDSQYISDKLKEKDEIRVTYQVLEQGSGDILNLEELFGQCTATVIANGEPHASDANIRLKKGSNSIKMMVSVLDGAYTVSAYLYCYVQEDENAFRLDSSLESNYEGSITKTNSLFTVYYDSVRVTKDGFSQFKKLTALLEYGDEKKEIPYTILDDGRISVVYDMKDQPYGAYKVTFTATSLYDVSKDATTSFANYPQSVVVTTDGNNKLEMTHHAFKSNTEGFSFLLKADGEDFVFNNGITRYTVTYNNQDVTADCVVEGNRLTFVPTFEKTVFGTIGADGVEEKVVVTISSSIKPELKSVAQATIKILPTIYEVFPVEGPVGEINRLKLSENEVSAYFAAKRDGEYFTAEELQAALDSGELALSSPYYGKGILPFSDEVMVETVNGIPVVRYCVKEGHSGFVRYLFTTFLTKKGDHPVSAVYATQGITDSASAESKLAIAPLGTAGVLSYIFRVILILLLIWAVHILITLITIFRLSPRHPRGKFVKILVDTYDPNGSPAVRMTAINIKASKRLIYRRLFFNLWAKQDDVGNGDMIMRVIGANSSQFCNNSNNECLIYESDDDVGPDDRGMEKLNQFLADVASGRNYRTVESMTNRELSKMFSYSHKVFGDEDDSSNVLPRNRWRSMGRSGHSPFLAYYDGQDLLRIVCFVPLTRQ